VKNRRWPARPPTHDYSDRSGFAQPIAAVRGIAAHGGGTTPLLPEPAAMKTKHSPTQPGQRAH
jgi:hypothetical protein